MFKAQGIFYPGSNPDTFLSLMPDHFLEFVKNNVGITKVQLYPLTFLVYLSKYSWKIIVSVVIVAVAADTRFRC
jgi:hypothetical protein